jgi:hypothetical protein
MVGFVLFVLFGLVVGFIARALMPGQQSIGLILTAIFRNSRLPARRLRRRNVGRWRWRSP